MAAKQQDVVVLTGFGPFKNHAVNASWEAVKLVPSPQFETELNAQIVIQEIPVEYEIVSKLVPDLWKKHNPNLVIHVGVSNIAKSVTLEKYARNIGYTREDVRNQKPRDGLCCCNGPTLVSCLLDLKSIAQQVEARTGVKACTSFDAGQYLCEFTYYLSLKEDPSSVVFVHVPVLDKFYSAEQLAAALKVVIQGSLDQAKKMRSNKLAALEIL